MLLFGPERVNPRGYSVPLGILLILWVLEVRVIPAVGKAQVEGHQDCKSEPGQHAPPGPERQQVCPDEKACDLRSVNPDPEAYDLRSGKSTICAPGSPRSALREVHDLRSGKSRIRLRTGRGMGEKDRHESRKKSRAVHLWP